jgi:hypothetical protein
VLAIFRYPSPDSRRSWIRAKVSCSIGYFSNRPSTAFHPSGAWFHARP